jgi:hypothetical protein
LHTTFQQQPTKDVGLIVDNERNLHFCLPSAGELDTPCGFTRANGDLTLDVSTPPTKGFLIQDGGGNLTFRVI